MTIAEKYYRLFYKVKPEVKLTNEQWKVVNMMHECLRENNKPKLPKGTIVVNRKQLLGHLNSIQKAVDSLDKVMLDRTTPPNVRGKQIAAIRNGLEMSCHSVKHFELKIPLDKMHELKG